MTMKYLFLALPIILFSLAPLAHAATIAVSPSTPAVPPGAPFTITVMLTSGDNPINVVEGSVLIPAGIVVDAASYAGSAFTLWPTPPQYAPGAGKVIFEGGVPGGVPSGTTATVFTLRAHTDTTGTYVFTPRDLAAYVNDGNGTLAPMTATAGTVVVAEGTPTPAILKGTPTPLTAAIGNDPSLFDGRFFVAFYGGDRGAGVIRYEVKEGMFGSFVPAGRYYVLTDQSLSHEVTVRAIDTNGIAAKTTLPATHGISGILIGSIVIILVVVLAVCIRRMRRTS